MSFLKDSSFAATIRFVASMAAIGGFVGGTLAWLTRLIDGRLGIERDIAMGDWVARGSVIGGWTGLLVVLGSLVSW